MQILLILLFPFIDLYLLFVLSDVAGPNITIFLVVFTGVLGFLLVRHQGKVGIRIASLSLKGIPPQQSLLDGPMLVISGILLMVPGAMSDIMGLLLLFPGFRIALFKSFLKKQNVHFASMVQEQERQPDSPTNPAEKEKPDSRTIDGEYKRED